MILILRGFTLVKKVLKACGIVVLIYAVKFSLSIHTEFLLEIYVLETGT